jgi:O-antigen ligase
MPGSTRSREVAFWTFAVQLWTVGALAISNVFMGVSAIAAIVARLGGVPRRDTATATASPAVVPRRLAVPLSAFVLVFLASTAFSYEPATSARRLGELLSLLPLLLALATVDTEQRARIVTRGLMLMGAVIAAFGLFQIVAGGAGVELGKRMPGPFSHYQTFAGVILLCAVLSLARLVAGGVESRTWRLAALAGIALPALALGLNLTRGSWVALAGAGLFLLAVRRPRQLLWVVPAAIAFVLVLPPAVRERAVSIFDLRDESNYDRLCMIDAGLRMIAERPLLGLGPGVVETRYPLYRHPTAPRDHRPHLHDSYLQLAAEYGTLSLVAFVAILAASFTQSFANYRREGSAAGPRADLHLGAAAALLAYTLAAFFEDTWADTEVQKIALFVIALPFCLAGCCEMQRAGALPDTTSGDPIRRAGSVV